MNSRNKYLLLISASPKTAARPSPRGDGRQPSRALREPPGVNPKLASNVALFGVTEIEGGFPHSEILGSKPVRGSPRLIAAYHVLHRLSAPRHSPDALKALDCSYHRYPRLGRSVSLRTIARTDGMASMQSFRKDQLASQIRSEDVGVAWPRSRVNKKLYNIRFRFPLRDSGRMFG